MLEKIEYIALYLFLLVCWWATIFNSIKDGRAYAAEIQKVRKLRDAYHELRCLNLEADMLQNKIDAKSVNRLAEVVKRKQDIHEFLMGIKGDLNEE